MTPRIVITYFDLPGAAEVIRWVLELAGVDWEDKRVSWEEFHAMKAGLNRGTSTLTSLSIPPVSQAIVCNVMRSRTRGSASGNSS